MVVNILADTSDIQRNVEKATQVVSDMAEGFTFGIVKAEAIEHALEKVGEMALHAAEEGVKLLVDEIDELAMRGSKVHDIADSFDRLTDGAGLAGDVLLGKLREGTRGTIGDFDLMKRSNQDLAAGLNLTEDQFATLAQGAFALAKATGGNEKEALDSVNDAMLTGRTRAVALLTGKIDLKAAEESFADSLGVTAKELTAEGKLEAAREAILQRITEVVGRLGEQHLTLADRVLQASTAIENFKDDLGLALSKSGVLQTGVETLGKAILGAFGDDRATAIHNLATLIENLAIIAVGAMAEISKATAEWLSEIDLVLQFAAKVPVLGDNFKVAAAGADVATKTAFTLSSAMFQARDAMEAAAKANTDFVGPINQAATGTDRFNHSAQDTGYIIDGVTEGEKRLAEWTKKLDDLNIHLFNTTLQEGKTVLKELAAEEDKKFNRNFAQFEAELAARAKLNAAYGLDIDGHIRMTGAAETLRLKLEELNRLKEQGIDVSQREAEAEAEYTKAMYDEAAAITVVGHDADDLSKEFDQAKGFMDGFHGSLALGIKTIDEYNKAISELYDSLSGSGGVGIPSATNAGSIGTPTGGLGLRTIKAYDVGGPILEDGPIMAHAGEYVVPRNGALVGGGAPSSSAGQQIIQLVVDGKVLASVVNAHNISAVKGQRRLGSS